jgi:ubiquinone/menaquinone biosynthesis C-methylase UbiE
MNNVKEEWQRTQLHWDDKSTIQSHNVPKSVILNWRKINRTLQNICREKDKNLVMVDVGCGSGKFYQGLEQVTNLYVGIDPSDIMLFDVSMDQNQVLIRGTGENLPLHSGIANVVLLKSVLDQCYSPNQVISESKRVLKDNGWIIISLSNRDSYYSFIRKIYNRLRGHKGEHVFESSQLFYFNSSEVEDMLKKENLKIVKSISLGYFVFPHFIQWIITGRIFPVLINLADRIGSAILPKRGGAFIIVGQKLGADS